MSRPGALVTLTALALALSACAPTSWEPELGVARQVVPSQDLPAEASPQSSNNNVSIALHDGLLFMAWRTAPSHFASGEAQIHVVSSGDLGESWAWETTFEVEADLREPLLYEAGGELLFSMFEAGTDPLAFEPHTVWRSRRNGPQDWAEAWTWGDEGEVTWEVRPDLDGQLFLTTYVGPHYDFEEEVEIDVRLHRSDDGVDWTQVGDGPVYRGGCSEAAFEFTDDGELWAVLRNEDGDGTGFGSLLCVAPEDDLSAWDCPDVSDPERYDSSRMFRHEGELWMVARRDVGGPYDQGLEGLSLPDERWENLVAYSRRPKRTALYRIDREARRVVHFEDLPSAGDTAFPSIVQLDEHRFLVANYSSPVEDPDRTWLAGQIAEDGTQIYLIEIEFQPVR
jgi:hypothetical protein